MSIPVFGKIEAGVSYVDRPSAYAFLLNVAGQIAVIRTPMGLFLPGGGLETGESEEGGLRRELMEEMGYDLLSARMMARAIQFHDSRFYRQHFKKIGVFFAVEARATPGAIPQPDHELIWLTISEAEKSLTQEFQRWAVHAFLASRRKKK